MNGKANSPKEHRIKATVDNPPGWVELDPPRVRIAEGDTVSWVFAGVPAGRRPALLFESFVPGTNVSIGSADPSLGPFRQLSRQSDEIHGSGFSGLAGEYMYTICLVAKDGDDLLVRKLQCRKVPAAGLVRDPGPRSLKSEAS